MYEAILSNILKEAEENTQKACEALLQDTNKVVPVQTGYLKFTGKVKEEAEGYSVIYTADYASEVHENPNGRGYKFLEHTLNQNLSKYENIIKGGR